jgi:hypothetical protein
MPPRTPARKTSAKAPAKAPVKAPMKATAKSPENGLNEMAEQIAHAAISNSAVGVGSLTLESCHQTFAQNFNRNINDRFSGSLVGLRWLVSDQSSRKKRGSSDDGSFVWSTRCQLGRGDTPASTNAATRYTWSSSSLSTIATIQSLSELSSSTTSTVSAGHDYS